MGVAAHNWLQLALGRVPDINKSAGAYFYFLVDILAMVRLYTTLFISLSLHQVPQMSPANSYAAGQICYPHSPDRKRSGHEQL
eukprot:1037877-Pleurochrysis_carterae.AAC.3